MSTSDPPSGPVKRWAPLAVTVALALGGGLLGAGKLVFDRVAALEVQIERAAGERATIRAELERERESLRLRVEAADKEARGHFAAAGPMRGANRRARKAAPLTC